MIDDQRDCFKGNRATPRLRHSSDVTEQLLRKSKREVWQRAPYGPPSPRDSHAIGPREKRAGERPRIPPRTEECQMHRERSGVFRTRRPRYEKCRKILLFDKNTYLFSKRIVFFLFDFSIITRRDLTFRLELARVGLLFNRRLARGRGTDRRTETVRVYVFEYMHARGLIAVKEEEEEEVEDKYIFSSFVPLARRGRAKTSENERNPMMI